MARLSILTTDEIKTLYEIPIFNEDERHALFELENDDLDYLETLEGVNQKVNYILQMGYYCAARYFFHFSFQQVKEDVEFILKQYFPNKPFPKKRLSKHHHYLNRQRIYKKYDLREADDLFFGQLYKEAKSLAKRHASPKFILQDLLTFCHQKQVVKPAYSTFQDVVFLALNTEKNRLATELYTDTNKVFRDKLDKLLENDGLFYNLTLIKKDQKDFTTTEIIKTVFKQQLIIGIYHESQKLFHRLDISEQNIIHYANLAEFYTIQKLRIFRSKNQVCLYLLCYIRRRFFKINDHLVSSFIHKMNQYIKLADDYQKSSIDTVEAVDKQLRNQAYKVLKVNVNDKIPDHQVRNKVFEIIPKENYKQFLSNFKKPNLSRDFYRWVYYRKIALTFKRNLRPIFKNLIFSCADPELTKAIDFLRHYIGNNKRFQHYDINDIPLRFFPKSLMPFLTVKTNEGGEPRANKIDGNRYEFMVYLRLKKGIEDITVHIKQSTDYRALEDELIDIEYWAEHKQQILSQLNMPLLSMNIVELLNDLQSSVESKYQYVNQRIVCNENTYVKIKYNKKGKRLHWTLPYVPLEHGINNDLFKDLPTKNITDIARFVAETTKFNKTFIHLQPKYAKTLPDIEIIHACIIANATGTEITKMNDISDIKGQDLLTANKNFIRVHTLKQANDIIINHTKKLPIFSEYNLSDYGVHASIDGQKFSTKFNTIKSRYSKKYFGMKKGVVVLTLNANSLPICLKVIGANEHESHYLLDMVESNVSDIEITKVSGDMHSINRVNFALMYMFGYRFMPRFTRLTDKTDNNLICFGNVADYDHYLIKPSKAVDKQLIIKEWDNVQRIMASLALKTTTQSTVVRKLSTVKKTNPTLKALIALDEIIMTDYLLGYIDSLEDRRAVQKALNRGESYHQLSAAIAKTNGGKMINGKTEIELDINAECIRLTANIIIHHNATILSGLYQHYKALNPEKAKEIIRWSPVAWKFVNLIGNYEFYKKDKVFDIQEVIRLLIKNSKIDIRAESLSQ